MILKTKRLYVLKAKPNKKNIEFYHKLWNSPEVMELVGFPEGLGLSKEKIEEQLGSYGESEFDCSLIIMERQSGKLIGECKLGYPNEQKISETDLKLLPEFRGIGYGNEIKNALCGYLFTKTDCLIVQASPNKLNIPSQKMQISCGGIKVDEKIWEAPKFSEIKKVDVHSFIYHIHRKRWMELNPDNTH